MSETERVVCRINYLEAILGKQSVTAFLLGKRNRNRFTSSWKNVCGFVDSWPLMNSDKIG